jgi:hypothetical protein
MAGRVPLIFLLVALPSPASLVMFQWTPERILLAADSLTTRIHDSGAIDEVTACKIRQQGDIFFTVVGINDDPAAKVDLVSLAARAARSSKNVRAAVHNFEVLAAAPVRTLWNDVVAHRAATARLATATGGRMTLTVVFVSRKEHAVAVKEYSGGGNGEIADQAARFYGAGPGMRQDRGYVAVGVYADAQSASAGRQIELEGIPFLNSFFEIQFAHELERTRQHAVPRIGPPVCILQVMLGTASWVSGQQGSCGPVLQQGN